MGHAVELRLHGSGRCMYSHAQSDLCSIRSYAGVLVCFSVFACATVHVLQTDIFCIFC